MNDEEKHIKVEEVEVEEEKTAAVTTVDWLQDKKGPRYRCIIDGRQYIQTSRKLKQPRAPKVPRVFTEEDRLRRKIYMVEYRRRDKKKMMMLEKLVVELSKDENQ
jgi:hypothetical protein